MINEFIFSCLPLGIRAYVHCGKCLDEMPNGTSPQLWADLEVGWTDEGLQVWCRRHNCNVMHVDFESQQHPADTSVPA